eukprot:m.334143 g.334143  ORF g.334143 m.334143 type:complete len:311 (-) comp17300_c0_seq1:169-1101(-)
MNLIYVFAIVYATLALSTADDDSTTMHMHGMSTTAHAHMSTTKHMHMGDTTAPHSHGDTTVDNSGHHHGDTTVDHSGHHHGDETTMDHNGHGGHGDGDASTMNDCTIYTLYTTQVEAEAAALLLGCEGSHAMGDKWMPGNTHTACGTCGEFGGHNMAFVARETAGEILFSSWTAETKEAYWLSFFGIILLGILHEYLKHVLRPSIVAMHNRKEKDAPAVFSMEMGDPQNKVSMEKGVQPAKINRFSLIHLADTIIFGTQITLGYFLMLIAMVYNAGLFVAVIVGLTLGYLFFAHPKGIVYIEADDGDCCD